MSAFVPARFTFSQRLLTILRLAVRDLRGGVRGFGVFLSCLAIGVAAIAGVGSLSRALSDGLAREGAVILGGDVAFSLALREATDEQKKFFASRGTVSEISTMRAMARTPEGDATLVIVTHDPALARRCDRVVRMNSGRVEEPAGREAAQA